MTRFTSLKGIVKILIMGKINNSRKPSNNYPKKKRKILILINIKFEKGI